MLVPNKASPVKASVTKPEIVICENDEAGSTKNNSKKYFGITLNNYDTH